MNRRVAAALLCVVTACSSGSSSTSPTTTTTRPAYTPVFAKGDCPTGVPKDTRVECGTLTVPENRSVANGRAVVLPVAIVHTADPSPAPDPVLYLSGGPGEAALPQVDRFLRKGQTGSRDVILLEQRGTGQSDPHLDCPEVTEAYGRILGDAASFDTEARIGTDALDLCLNRLRASSVDLNQYNTAAVADDVADLRVAMGISQWNLFGVSYGTMDALVTMRMHPEGIRSVVLDSVIPPDIAAGAAEVFANVQRVERVLLDGCRKDDRCNAAYPSLEADLDATVHAFDSSPYRGVVNNPITHQPTPITVNGADLVGGLYVAMSDTDLIPAMPSIIEQLKGSQPSAILDELAIRAIRFVDSIAAAQAAVVNCFDRGTMIHDGDAQRVVAQHPEAATVALFIAASCAHIGIAAAPAGFNDPVRSDIPTLLLAGEYDPQTPPAQAAHAAETLTHSTVVQFPGMGHAQVFATPECPEVIFRAFLADPMSKPDTSCVAAMGPPNWLAG